jgi:hypothetical protein
VCGADDNVGHWQVMPHPSRSGWTRLLYSCKVKLLPWIPEFVVSFLTSKALTEVGNDSALFLFTMIGLSMLGYRVYLYCRKFVIIYTCCAFWACRPRRG